MYVTLCFCHTDITECYTDITACYTDAFPWHMMTRNFGTMTLSNMESEAYCHLWKIESLIMPWEAGRRQCTLLCTAAKYSERCNIPHLQCKVALAQMYIQKTVANKEKSAHSGVSIEFTQAT